MPHYNINVSLPPNWEQVPNESGAFRRRESGGMLRITLQPPLAGENPSELAVTDALKSLVSSLNMDLGIEIHAVAGASPLGMAATSIRKSEQHGMVQFWLIAGQITVFASFAAGNLQGLAEAQQILSGLQLESGVVNLSGQS